MTKPINHQVIKTEASGIRLVLDLVKKPADQMIELTVGEIDLPTPVATKEAGKQAISNNVTKYTENMGFLSLRRVISDYIKRFYEVSYSPENEILVTVGASQGIDLTVRTLINAGDEVILIGPAYPAYIQAVVLAGAIPIVVDTRATHFRLSPEQLESAISSKTKLVILNYPNNPTGIVLSKEELSSLASVIQKYDLYVLTDDVYQRLTYNQDCAPSIASAPLMKERTIIVNGLSKSHSMTGWRIGYLAGPKVLIQEIYKIQQANVGCASSISQMAALTALTIDIEAPKTYITVFRKRRDYVLQRLDEMSLKYTKPDGAFYVFIDVKLFGMSSWDFVAFTINESDLVLVHGSAFTEAGEGYVRLSFANEMKVLVEAMNRLEKTVDVLTAKNPLI
ncbi:pyridoxal phosphate-dependent aminotransferase [Leuconostoc suionicum]|uniref:pyridoxal phosphate-dependent aminotransferase n=1 Tax=Leuconostoc suionicum TaxID=1511761 RepID=UPI003748AC75